MAKKTATPAEGNSAAEPHVQGTTPVEIPKGANFDFAVNRVKLSRAISFVNSTQAGLKGKDLESAVKDRYVEIGGLLIEDKPVRSGPHRKGLSHDVE